MARRGKAGRDRRPRRPRRSFERLEARLLLTATARDGIPYIDLGTSDNVAWDQPRVTIEFLENPDGTGSVGPQVFNSMLLDTGASTYTIMATAVREMSDPPHPYETEGKFEEFGVAGTQLFDVSRAYRLDFAGNDGERNTLLDTRVLSDPNRDFSQFGPWGVIGMPTMVDRVTTLDYTVWETVQGLDLFMGVEFRDDLPESNGHRYTIDVDNRLEFHPEDHIIGDCCAPGWGDVPFLTAYPMHNGAVTSGTFLYDTGAQVSILSSQLALDIGLDSNDDGVLDENDANFARFETVGGIGGAISVPAFLFDEVHVPTQSGVDLVWTDLQWLVLDIVPGLDGVFGSDLMTSGWLEGFATAGRSGWIDQIQMDFRNMEINGTSEIHFDLNEQVDNLIDPNGPGARLIESGSQTTVSEIGVDDTYELVLTQQPSADVIVTLSNPDEELMAVDNAQPTNDFLTFTPANWNVAQTVRVSAFNDSRQEAFHRSSIFHRSSSADPAYEGVGMPRLIANIIDDEFAGVVTIPTDGATEVSESGQTDTYDLVLTVQPTEDVTLAFDTVGNQVTAVDHFNPTNNYVTFTPSNWNIPQTVRITAIDDSIAEGIHDAYVTHDIVTSATEYLDAFPLQEFITITDNDTVGGIIVDPTEGLTTTEGSGQATFSIAIQTEPVANVEIDLTSTDITEGTVFPNKLIFTPENWLTPQLVTVTGVNDGEVDGDIPYAIETAPAVSADPVYHGRDPENVTVMNIDDDVSALTVTALIPNNSGFSMLFNNPLDTSSLNLYDTELGGLGVADAVMAGANSGPVRGSLVVDPSLTKLTFVKTGGPLEPDNYTITLRSATDGFKTTTGALLDGNGDGTTGDDFIAAFNVLPPAENAVRVGIPDIVRGPGQDVHLPADAASGIPLNISEGAGVRSVNMQISYDPTLLDITAANVAAGMPAGSTVALNRPIPGLAIVTFTSPTDLPDGEQTFVNLQAKVPTADATENYKRQQVLDVHAVTISTSTGVLPSVDDDAVHVASYFGDPSGNGRINASDAALVARVAALLDGGFASAPMTDPMMLGDISGNDRINAADASRVASVAALIPVSEIPPIPSGVLTAGSVRATTQTTSISSSTLLPNIHLPNRRPGIYEWIEQQEKSELETVQDQEPDAPSSNEGGDPTTSLTSEDDSNLAALLPAVYAISNESTWRIVEQPAANEDATADTSAIDRALSEVSAELDDLLPTEELFAD